MMKFELGLEEPDPKRAGRSALTIAGSYIAGGLIPLAPYFFLRSIHSALIVSVIVTLLALLVFGTSYTRGIPLARQTGNRSAGVKILSSFSTVSFFLASRRGNRLMAVAVVVRNLIG